MAFDKNELKQIEKVVGGVEERLGKRIDGVEQNLGKEISGLDKKISGVEQGLVRRIELTKKEIIAVLSREITDLAEINHAVINQVSKIAELEKRLVRLETIVLKGGLK